MLLVALFKTIFMTALITELSNCVLYIYLYIIKLKTIGNLLNLFVSLWNTKM